MAVYFDVSGKKNNTITDEMITHLLADGNESEIEAFMDNDDDGASIDLERLNIQPLPSLEEPSTSKVRAPRPKKLKKTKDSMKLRKRIWKQMPYAEKNHAYPNLPVVSVRTPMEYFHDYFNDDFFELIAECTNTYHLRKTGEILKTTAIEIRKLIGVHLAMGCIPYPRFEMYWRQGMQLNIIANALRRERFKTLRSSLHLVGQDTAPPDCKNPLWKVQPIIDKIKSTCSNLERVPGYYSIDEQMIPFTGRCGPGLRQVVKNKPRPVGLKNFVMTTKDGLMLDFDIYQGANTSFSDKSLGVGPSVILHLAKSIPPGSCVYFDRYFTTIPLIERLYKLRLHGTGTLMFNRLAERNVMKFKKDNEMLRGESQQFVSKNVVVVKWKDNKSVLVTSNCTGANISDNVSRWDKKNKCYVTVTAPKVITNYNSYMGGVDVLDQMMEYYRSFIKTRKWTLKVIIHFFDLAVVNAWRLYRNEAIAAQVPKNKIMDLLAFKMQIAEGLIETPNRKRRNDSDEDDEEKIDLTLAKRYRPAIAPAISKRFDGYDHYPVFDDIINPRCCRFDGCNSRSKIKCEKCNVYLCLSRYKSCYKSYHIHTN